MQIFNTMKIPDTKVFCTKYLNNRQKLSKRQVLRFPGFHPNVGKTFVVFASSVLKVPKKAIAQLNIHLKNFHGSSKICENCTSFLLRSFCCLRYSYIIPSCRGVPIIGAADILATDMLIFTVSVIGTDKLQSRYKCRYSASKINFI